MNSNMTKDLNLAILELGIDDGDWVSAAMDVQTAGRAQLAATIAEIANGDPFIVADALRRCSRIALAQREALECDGAVIKALEKAIEAASLAYAFNPSSYTMSSLNAATKALEVYRRQTAEPQADEADNHEHV